jgi:CRISPR-associated protein Csx14
MPDHPHVLVATLGSQPQIVTFTLELLLQRNFPIDEVFVIHPFPRERPRLQHSLACLQTAFTDYYPRKLQRTIHFHSCVLHFDGQPIDDINDDTHADGTLETIHRLIGDLKRQGYRMHLSVSGGRRLMALLAISVASFNFDRHDRIWHIYTPEALMPVVHDGAVMHLIPDSGIRLIQGPFVALGSIIYSPDQSFRSAREEQRVRAEAEERTRCAQIVQQATPAQRRVLEAFARGLTPQEVADELMIAPVTVNSHKTVLLGHCYNTWNIPPKPRLTYTFLRTKFEGYFDSKA